MAWGNYPISTLMRTRKFRYKGRILKIRPDSYILPSMRYLVVLLAYAAGAGLALRGFVFAAALFLWNDIFQPLEFAKNPGALPVAQFVTAVLLGTFLLDWFRGRVRPRTGPFLYLFAGMILWIGVTTALSSFHQVAVEEFIIYLKYLIPLVLIHVALSSQQQIRILCAVLAGSVGIWAMQAGVHTLVSGPSPDIGIPGGQMGDRNDFAAAMVGTIPILFYFMLSYRWRFKLPVRIGCALAIFLTLSAIILSLSRGASIGLAAQLVLFVGYVSKKKIRDFILICLACGIALMLLPQSWWDRMSTINVGSEQTEGSAKQRMTLLIGAYHASVDHPVFGLGPGGWLEVAEAYTGDNHNPHNIYLVLSSETGIPGLIIYLIVVIFTYLRVSRVIRLALKRGDLETARLGSALVTCIFGLLSAMTFLNRPFNEYLWAWVAIANALPAIYARESKGKRAGGGSLARGRGAAVRRGRWAGRGPARTLPGAAGSPPQGSGDVTGPAPGPDIRPGGPLPTT